MDSQSSSNDDRWDKVVMRFSFTPEK